MLKLKEDYNKNSKIIENNIDQIQHDESSCNKNLMHSRRNDNIENRITELQKKPENLSLSFLPNLTSLKLNS